MKRRQGFGGARLSGNAPPKEAIASFPENNFITPTA
jgi:hypothetical protein